MTETAIPVPCLSTFDKRPLHQLEQTILQNIAPIESWFRNAWHDDTPLITTSVDLRNAGFKIAPIDTNLFPAGFNNLSADLHPLCVQAMQTMLSDYFYRCKRVGIIAENHTRNPFYLESLAILKNIVEMAGFDVRITSLDENRKTIERIALQSGGYLDFYPMANQDGYLFLDDIAPCLFILNNDLSSGYPEILKNVEQPIFPAPDLGWFSRLKSTHFDLYDGVTREFASLINIDPWLLSSFHESVGGLDFMAQEGVDALAESVERILRKTRDKYHEYDIHDKPFAVIKADNGTYGMSVMMVQDAAEVQHLNRKQRTKMSASKGSKKVDRVLVQEGVYTFESMPDNSVAEPVVYMIGSHVVGGFYRVHQERGVNENLNAPGMHFEPLAFAKPCNTPRYDLLETDCPNNRFYAYGVIARLAALAAAREVRLIKKGT